MAEHRHECRVTGFRVTLLPTKPKPTAAVVIALSCGVDETVPLAKAAAQQFGGELARAAFEWDVAEQVAQTPEGT